MKRKMVWIGVPWLLTLYLTTACRISVSMCLLPAVFMLLGAFRLFRRISTAQLLCILVSVCLAFGSVLLYRGVVMKPVLAHDGTYGTFSGKVISCTAYDGDKASYQVKGSFGDGASGKLLVYTDDLGADYGDTLEIAGGFSALSGNALWNGTAYYQAKGIFLEVSADAYVRCVPTDHAKTVRMLRQYRAKISARICTLAGTEAGGLVSAMLLGTKSTISSETNALLTQQGMRHVASVSGMHLVLLLSVWMALSKRIRLDRRLAFLGAFAWILFYAVLVETPVSILRAGLMYLLVLSGPLFFRRADTLNSLCIAGILMTLFNPYRMQDASFLLSLTGTFGIGVFAPWMTARLSRKKACSKLGKQFLSMCCVSAAIFPVTLLYFREVSVSSPVANLFLLPLCSLMLLLAFCIFMTGGIGIAAKPICFLLKILYDCWSLLAHGLQRIFPLAFPVGWDLLPLLAAVLLVLVCFVFWVKRRRSFVALSLAASFFLLSVGEAVYTVGRSNKFIIAVLGQEQEMTLLISYQGKTDLIDLTGNHRNPEMAAAYLTRHGIRQLQSVILTKRAPQMRVAYAAALESIPAAETVVPAACWVPSDSTFLRTKPQNLDAAVIADSLYQITVADGIAESTYGNLHFCIGTKLENLPQEQWNVVLGISWNGNPDDVPENLYQKTQPMELIVSPDGTWTMQTIVLY